MENPLGTGLGLGAVLLTMAGIGGIAGVLGNLVAGTRAGVLDISVWAIVGAIGSILVLLAMQWISVVAPPT